MKFPFIITTLFFIILSTSANAEDLLCQFNSNSYTGWIYSRTSINITSFNIQNNKINIYGDYKLTSPSIDFSGVNYAKVDVVTNFKDYLSSNYSYVKASPCVELLDLNDNILALIQYKYAEAKLEQTFTVFLPIPNNALSLKVRISAPDGDVNSTGAVKSVNIYSSSVDPTQIIKGDVDGDGKVDTTDLSALISIILNNGTATDSPAADVDGDGKIDTTDISALMSIILAA